MRLFQRLVVFVLILAVLALGAMVAFLGYGTATGTWRAMPVLSNSMAPSLHRGDIILLHKSSAFAARPGQIAVFKSPDQAQGLVVHRIVSVTRAPSGTEMHTKGDANTAVDPWTVTTTGDLWTVGHVVPGTGQVVHVLSSSHAQLALMALTVPAFVYFALRYIWRNVAVNAVLLIHKTMIARFGKSTLAIASLSILMITAAPAAALWSSNNSRSGTYSTAGPSAFTPTNGSCAWNGDTATVNWTPPAGTVTPDGYKIDNLTLNTGTATSTQTISGGSTATANVTYTAGSQRILDNYMSLFATRNNWESNRVTVPAIACSRWAGPIVGSGNTSPAVSTSVNTAVANLSQPAQILRRSTSTMLVAETGNHQIDLINTTTPTAARYAGSGTAGYSNTGSATTSNMRSPEGFTGSSPNYFIGDTGNNVIRKYASSGGLTTLAGPAPDGTNNPAATGFVDSTTPANVRFNQPSQVSMEWVNATGSLYVADAGNNAIRVVDASTGATSTIAGTGAAGSADGNGPTGGAGPGGTATFNNPRSVISIDYNEGTNLGRRTLFVADTGNNKIRKIDTSGSTAVVSTIAGTGTAGSADGAALSATFNQPRSIMIDKALNIYVADTGNNEIRVITAASNYSYVYTLAGSTSGYSGNGSSATTAKFNGPRGIGINGATTGPTLYGDIFVSDSGNNRIRSVSRTQYSLTTLNVLGSQTGPGSYTDNQDVELGMRFFADTSGQVTGGRFYRVNGFDDGTAHTVSLWNAAGTRLAFATSGTGTSTGWVDVPFATPVDVTAGAEYTISYHVTGTYYAKASTFDSQLDNGFLHAYAGSSGGNGKYLYQTTIAKPTTSSGNNASYFIDVNFRY